MPARHRFDDPGPAVLDVPVLSVDLVRLPRTARPMIAHVDRLTCHKAHPKAE